MTTGPGPDPTPRDRRQSGYLTSAEQELIQRLGECMSTFGRFLASDMQNTPPLERALMRTAHDGDLAEFVAHIHDLQHAVMARAARRAHPRLFPARYTTTTTEGAQR